MHRLAPTILILAVLVAACGDDGAFGTTSAPSTTAVPETTEASTTAPTSAPETTVSPEATTSSLAPPAESTTAAPVTVPEAFYLVDPANFFPDVFPDSNGGHGSGCVVPDYVTLPDGVWFGFAEAVGGGMIDFDLACFFTGAAAVAAAAEDGEVAVDFYIRNNVAVTYEVLIAADARVWYIDMLSGDVTSPTEIPLAAWPSPDSYQTCPGEHCSVWLYVNGGSVTGIVEQYVP